MSSHRCIIRLLLVLLLFMQYATLAHSTEHHLFSDPDHCAECTLQQQFGQTGIVVIHQSALPAVVDQVSGATVSCPVVTLNPAFHSRAPPLASLN